MTVKDLFNLSGQIAIITGGGGLLGVKHAEAVAESGGIPVLVDIDPERLKKAKETLGDFSHEVFCCDVTEKCQVKDLFDQVKRKYNQVNILINNAASNPKVEDCNIQLDSRFEHYSLEMFQKEVNIGLTAALICSQIFGTHMAEKRAGVILNISSDLGIVAPNQSLYRVSGVSELKQPVKPVSYSIIKHGIIGLTRYLATYWANSGIRCNALAPGGVENGQSEDFLSRIQPLIPMGRMAKIDEYKAAVVFLVSQASSYMTGAILSVDGGRTCW